MAQIRRPSNQTHSGRVGIDLFDPASIAAAVGNHHANDALAKVLAMIRRARPSWMADGVCVGSGLDFTNPSTKARAACLQACGRCPVLLDCRAWSLTIDDRDAVLGGLDPAARKQARKRMEIPDATP